MKALLMHKNIEVASIEYEDGIITALRGIWNKEHMPIGTYKETMPNQGTLMYLQAWQKVRAIPSDRLNLQFIFDSTDKTISQLSEQSHGMNLTDRYWIKGYDEDITWEDINFHKNGFQFSELTLTGKGEAVATPDYETNGTLPKAWVIINNIPTLLKDSPTWLPTASANETVAYQLASYMDIPHAMYYPVAYKDKVLCASPCFVSEDKEEFVSLQQIQKTKSKGSALTTAKHNGLDDTFIAQMTAFDLLIGNIDRHEGNLGIMINPDDMTLLRAAPLFDSGSCLMQWMSDRQYFKPFYDTKDEALKHISDCQITLPDWDIIEDIVKDTYKKYRVEEYINPVLTEIHENRKKLESCLLEIGERKIVSLKREDDDLCL